MEMDALRDLYVEELKDLYSAEKQLVRALPKMAKNAANPDLKNLGLRDPTDVILAGASAQSTARDPRHERADPQ
jgi:hypothetical protein